MEEGANAAVSQSVNGLEEKPSQKGLVCVWLFSSLVFFVCVGNVHVFGRRGWRTTPFLPLLGLGMGTVDNGVEDWVH